MLDKLQRWRNWSEFNEEATLIGVVLPILREAGYDPFNPEEVFPQGKDDNKLKPDLLLYQISPLEGGKPHMVVEVKALGKNLSNFHNQLVQYMNGVPSARWYVLTNGEVWEFYDRQRSLPLSNCLRFRAQVKEPGGLQAIVFLLKKEHTEIPFHVAEQMLAEATLEQAASQVPFADQQQAYRITGEIAKPIRDALSALTQQFPDLQPYLKQWESEWRQKLEDKRRQEEKVKENYKSWAEALFSLALWAYSRDRKRAEKILKILPEDYKGPLSTKKLPDGKHLSVNYSVRDKKKLLKRLAEEFPELKGVVLKIEGEKFVL